MHLSTVKLLILMSVIIAGGAVVGQGYWNTLQRPPLENPIKVDREMDPGYGPANAGPVGNLTIWLQPTEGYVIGDRITTDIAVRVVWQLENESMIVRMRFPDSQSIDPAQSRTDPFTQNRLIELEYNHSRPDSSIYTGRIILWYDHEGEFGVNVTVYSLYTHDLQVQRNTTQETEDWPLLSILRIRPYSYVQERRDARIASGWNLVAVGVGIIGVGSVVALFSEQLAEKLQRFRKKEPDHSSEYIG